MLKELGDGYRDSFDSRNNFKVSRNYKKERTFWYALQIAVIYDFFGYTGTVLPIFSTAEMILT
jgi:hypothetical protein